MGPALLAQIVEAPDDDALKLVYADWLEEQGHSFAELIRAQCAGDAKRAASALRKHRKDWLGDVSSWFDDKQPFARGMLDRLYGPAGKYAQKATQKALLAVHSVFGVRRTLLRGQAAKLPACETLGYTSALAWLDSQADDKLVGALAESPHVARLSSLDLDKVRCTNTGLGKLARSKYLTRVRHFGLPGPVNMGSFDEDAVIAVLERLPIESLKLGHTYHVSPGVLGNADAATKLKTLTYILDRKVKQLLQARKLTALESLDLNVFDYVDDDAIAPVLENPALAKLTSLRLSVPRALSDTLVGRLRTRFGSKLAYSATSPR